MSMHERPPLDAEERQLAAQLSRIAPRGEPSAQLDARILAMAERGIAGHHAASAPARRRRPRWPAWLGVAASLTAVAGLIWQVHPILSPRNERIAPVAISSADHDAADHAAADDGERQPIRYVEPAAAIAPPTEPPPPLPPARTARSTSEAASAPALASTVADNLEPADTAAATARTRAAAPIKPAQTVPISADIAGAPEPAANIEAAPAPWPADNARKAASPMRNKASASTNVEAAAPSPPSAERSPSASAAASDTLGSRMHSPPPRAAIAPAPAAAPPASAPVPMSAQRADSHDIIEFDERPPATTADSDVQKAWLERIRGLKSAGEVDEARSSLKEFSQRHPKAEIPADLKPLLVTGTP
ncbi:MAG: hypothetical protein Q4G62_12115 [Pseudomonadota bacterium]|nr:hypothetical protein [Pseudomonadota bacterium]